MHLDRQIWWEAPNRIRIPTGIAIALLLGLPIRNIYLQAKNAPKRSPRVRRIELIVAAGLWSFIAITVGLLLFMQSKYN
jgi:hypothetical protein